MGFSLKKITKSIGKVASKAVKSVGNVTKPLANSVGKIADGKIGEGLGDIGQTGARMGLDIATVGNKNLVDSYTGGFMTSTENAARGNTKDIARVGVTGATAYFGGPLATFAANTAFANGANAFQAAAGAAGAAGIPGGELISKVFGPSPKTNQLASQIYPEVPMAASPIYPGVSPEKDKTMMMMAIGGMGLIGFMFLMVMMMQKRK